MNLNIEESNLIANNAISLMKDNLDKLNSHVDYLKICYPEFNEKEIFKLNCVAKMMLTMNDDIREVLFKKVGDDE